MSRKRTMKKGVAGMPAYRRIADGLGAAITGGKMAPGAKLESERGLAGRHGVSLMTARRALVELERQGLVTRRVGAGTFVAPELGQRRRLRDPHAEWGAESGRVVESGKGEWVREWNGGGVRVTERVTLAVDGALGTRPLLEYLGEAACYAAEEIQEVEGGLGIRQTIYGPGQEVLARREMRVEGGGVSGWLER